MRFEFGIVSGRTVHRIVHADLDRCMEVVREAYLAHHRGQSVNPPSQFLRFPHRPEARIIALPAHLGGAFGVSGIKWIASYPANVRRRIPRASAVLVLNRDDTGHPFVCMEASIISAARTAASAVLAAEALRGGDRRVGTVGIVGAGFIARYVLKFLAHRDWRCERLLVYDIEPHEADRFREAAGASGLAGRAEVAGGLAGAVGDADLLLLATTASTPHIDGEGLLRRDAVVLNISLRDLAPGIILASQNVVDDVDHVLTAGTSPQLAERLTGRRDFITGTIAQVLLGEVTIDRGRPVVFSPFGMGILDVAVGQWVHDEAVKAGEVTRIEDFFFDMAR